MKISAKIDYACRALLELSLHWPNKHPLQINVIARNQKIPTKFLTHILINLKQLGFVESIRGKSGGYILSRNPQEIKLGEVVSGLGGLGLESAVSNSGKSKSVLDQVWTEINDSVLQKMDEITFHTITDRLRSQNETLMFDI